MAPAKSRCAPSGQTVATGRGLYIRRVRSEFSIPFVFSPCVILSALPLEQNRILGDTDLGEVAEAAPPTSDGSEGKLQPPQPLTRMECGQSESQSQCLGPALTRPGSDASAAGLARAQRPAEDSGLARDSDSETA